MLNTAALPDLIFTVLFFFMVVTHIRTGNPQVETPLPASQELTARDHRSAALYIYIGVAMGRRGGEPRIQVGNRMVAAGEVASAVREYKNALPQAEGERMMVVIRADRGTRMEVVQGVRQSLREAGALRVFYAGQERRAPRSAR